jgi:23S rRNA (cytidine1920-2'-O)/16S rRNA (cytidine1409-2'-O)-methyltransferase
MLTRDLAPPAGDVSLRPDLSEPLDVAGLERPQAYSFTFQLGHDRDHRSVKKRVDVLLVERGLAESRTHAQALVLAGRVPGHAKPGEQVDDSAELAVTEGDPYVSRGGIKLANALDAFAIDPAGRDCLDVGASTGGFTDVLLQRDAARVIALDVGYGQLHPRIRGDPRVVVLERTNARGVTELPFAPELVVCDVSFISVRKALPPLLELAARGWEAVVLVKPQFEAGPADVRGGVVRDPETRRRVARQAVEAALAWGAETAGVVDSGLPGPKGNRELFLHLVQRATPRLPAELDAWIGDALA